MKKKTYLNVVITALLQILRFIVETYILDKCNLKIGLNMAVCFQVRISRCAVFKSIVFLQFNSTLHFISFLVYFAFFVIKKRGHQEEWNLFHDLLT